jgi:hypothetical protein
MDPINQSNKTTNHKVIHTLSEDMAVAIQDNKDGFVKKIIHEQEEKENEKILLAVYSRRNKIYLALALVFVIMASGVVGYVFFKDSVDSLFVRSRFTPLIFHESSQVLDITNKTRENIIDMVQSLVMPFDRETGTVQGVYFLENKKTVGFNKFLNLIQSNFIGTSDLFNENFLVGIIKHSNSSVTAAEENSILEESSNEPKKLLENYITLSDSSFFKAGTNEFIDIEAKNRAKELIGYFLDVVSFDASKIQIFGTFPTERLGDRNQEIADARRQIGLSLFNEVLKEKYTDEQISKISIESSVKGVAISDIYTEERIAKMPESEKNEKIDLNQGITYLAKSKTASADSTDGIILEPTANLQAPKEVNSIFPKNTDLFFLIKVNSLADVFNQMRSWENKMFTDLHGFFGVEIFADTSYLLTKDFVDGIIQNKNARILYDETGKIVLMYVYLDESSVVITNNENTTREVIARVNSSKIKR